LPAGESEDFEVAGVGVFGGKSQGYPYHYAMLAVAIPVENSFRGHALVHGNVSRTQAEQVVPWAEAVLGRQLRLPVVTESARLWHRLAKIYAGEPDGAVRRFLGTCSEQEDYSWRTLLELEDGPDESVLRRVYQSELAHYQSLRQRGVEELIAALCETDGGLDRAFDWVFGPSDSSQPCRFAPEELLECLCDLLVPIPPDERAVLDALTPPPDELPTIHSVIFQMFSSLMGKPVACNLYAEDETIAAEFAARWPEQAERFRERLQERIAKSRVMFDQARAALDKRLAALDAEERDEETEEFSPAMEGGTAYEPAAEFLYTEIARQRRKPAGMQEFARQLGGALRASLANDDDFRHKLDNSTREQLLQYVSLGSRARGFALRKSAWEKLEQATTEELHHLLMVALHPESESSFCEARVHLLETPDLGRYLPERNPRERRDSLRSPRGAGVLALCTRVASPPPPIPDHIIC
jgi:hypothetical protein